MNADDRTLYPGADRTLRMPRPGGSASAAADATVRLAPQRAGDVVDAADATRRFDPAADDNAATVINRGAQPGPTLHAPASLPATQATRGTESTQAAPRRERRAEPSPVAAQLQRLVAGVNPLLGAASVLLGLVGPLRQTVAHPDPAGLRTQLLERIREFEAAAAAQGVARHQVVAARYLLCTMLDEALAGTPWGAEGRWAPHALLPTFHDDDDGGDKAFRLLERLGEDPVANRDLLELFHVAMALGFEGRFRNAPQGRAQRDAVAARLYEIVRPVRAAGAPRELSLRWRGVATRGNEDLRVLPLWVVVAVAGALLLATALALNAWLDARARPVFGALHDVAASLAPPAAGPAAQGAPGAAPARLAALGPDVAARRLAVRDEPARSVVVMPADRLFVPGTARLAAEAPPLLQRVAAALADQPGRVVVSGHTDGRPTGSLQYPSGWHLSRARADAVAEALARGGVPSQRLRAEGRADTEPLGAGAAARDRSADRRVEIELRPPRPGV